MIAIIQRVKHAKVDINTQTKAQIQTGLVALLGITHSDTEKDVDWLASKVVNLRIFEDEQAKMNKSVKDIEGDILLVSQFTLHADTKKGNRPSFMAAAKPQEAELLYEKMKDKLHTLLGKNIQTGSFGADMQVSLQNDGPVTIIIDTEKYLR